MGTEPTARITRSVSISVPSNWPPIFTLASSVTEPKPSIRSILFFLNSIATPPVSVLITLSRCFVGAGVVDRRALDLDPEVAGVLHLHEHLGHAQHRLRRDAGLVQAAAADVVLLHHGRLQAELRGADRGHVAAGTRSDHDAVVFAAPASGRVRLSNERGSAARASGCAPSPSPGTRRAFRRRPGSTTRISAEPMLARLEQRQRREHDRDAEQRLHAEHRPVAAPPHAPGDHGGSRTTGW